MSIRRIGFIQDTHSLNGAVRVSVDTARYLLRRFGIPSVFINPSHLSSKGRMTVPLAEDVAEIFLDSFTKGNGAQDASALEEIVRQAEIDLLFVPYPTKHLPAGIERLRSCRVAYWYHEHPYGKYIRKRQLLDGLSHDPVGRQIDYFLTQWPKYYLFGEITKRRIQRDLLRKIQESDYFITLTSGYRDLLIRDLKLKEEEARKLVVLRNALTIEPDPMLRKEKLAVFMGRIMRDTKQVDKLFDIWRHCASELPDWKFQFYGKGSYVKTLVRDINKSGLPNISYEGYTSDPESVFRRAAFSCITSSTEGYCQAITEAQNQGCIPIAFDSPGAFHEVIGTIEPAGILIHPYDTEAYATSLISLARDEAERARLQERVLRHRHHYEEGTNDSEWHRLLELH